jgi:hypothetical protein
VLFAEIAHTLRAANTFQDPVKKFARGVPITSETLARRLAQRDPWGQAFWNASEKNELQI